MIDYQKLAYDACRCYVEDWKLLVGLGCEDLVLGWIRSRNLEVLASCPDHIPDAYSDPGITQFARQVAAFFKKNAAFADSERCDAAAQEAFEAAENYCLATNITINDYTDNGTWNEESLRADFEPELVEGVLKATNILADMCGDFDEFLAGLPERIQVTAGATATRSRRESLPYLKVRKRGIPASTRAQPWLDILCQYYGYGKPSFDTCNGNRVQTVPKNWKTSRTIAAEPEGNMALQLCFDSWGKERLLKYGVDLRSQIRNQSLAREASIHGRDVTVDLSQASDTCAFNTVWALFPYKWAQFLTDVRSPSGEGFGDYYWYTKFSSMGNGATFAIETMIFTALAKAAGARKYAVYGDDLVVSKTVYPRLKALLEFFGFIVNTEKTYTDGPFRESCGTDWCNGVNVTPFYLRTKSKMKIELCHVVNGLVSLALGPGGKLLDLAWEITAQHNLPFVPFNESSISGVWITPGEAYNRKLIFPEKGWGSPTRIHKIWKEEQKQRKSNKTPKLFQPTPDVYGYKAFVPKSRKHSIVDTRTYFLWHLDAAKRKKGSAYRRPLNLYLLDYNSVDLESDDAGVIIRSTVPVFTQKYVRKWVRYHPVASATPVHLTWWTDYLIRLIG